MEIHLPWVTLAASCWLVPKALLLCLKDKVCPDCACNRLFTQDAIFLPTTKVAQSGPCCLLYFIAMACLLSHVTWVSYISSAWIPYSIIMFIEWVSLYSYMFHIAVHCHDEPLTLGFSSDFARWHLAREC